MRFAIEIARRVVAAAPGMMVGARMSLTDWVDGGLTLEEAIEVARAYRKAGIAYICCSSGGNSPHQSLRTGPGYQVHLAEAVKQATGIPVRAVGIYHIGDPKRGVSVTLDLNVGQVFVVGSQGQVGIILEAGNERLFQGSRISSVNGLLLLVVGGDVIEKLAVRRPKRRLKQARHQVKLDSFRPHPVVQQRKVRFARRTPRPAYMHQ